MRVLMLRFGGVMGNVRFMAGQEYDVPEELAKAMFRDGRAIETTQVSPRQNAAKRTGKATR